MSMGSMISMELAVNPRDSTPSPMNPIDYVFELAVNPKDSTPIPVDPCEYDLNGARGESRIHPPAP